MKVYKVAVMEYYRKVISVEAESEKAAHQRAWDAYNNVEFVVIPENDYDGTEIYVLDEWREIQEGEKREPHTIEGYVYTKEELNS